jgi:hypothetical protein
VHLASDLDRDIGLMTADCGSCEAVSLDNWQSRLGQMGIQYVVKRAIPVKENVPATKSVGSSSNGGV